MNKPRIKFVKKANCWCLTYWDKKEGQQRKWFSTQEKAEQGLKEIKIKEDEYRR